MAVVGGEIGSAYVITVGKVIKYGVNGRVCGILGWDFGRGVVAGVN